MTKIITILSWLVLITLSIGIARQLSEQKMLYPVKIENLLEKFDNPAQVSDKYTLLPLETTNIAGNLTAKTCYEKDFLAQTTKTGNYIQRTNNFRHAAPDNCSAPLTEFVGSFYKNP